MWHCCLADILENACQTTNWHGISSNIEKHILRSNLTEFGVCITIWNAKIQMWNCYLADILENGHQLTNWCGHTSNITKHTLRNNLTNFGACITICTIVPLSALLWTITVDLRDSFQIQAINKALNTILVDCHRSMASCQHIVMLYTL